MGHFFIMFSISLFISGQNNDCLACFLQLSIPKCLRWIRDFISARRVVSAERFDRFVFQKDTFTESHFRGYNTDINLWK